jgi:hypothetical protein
MLKVQTPTGTIELTAAQEQRFRSLSDADVCELLNTGADFYALAVLVERAGIRFDPVGERFRHGRMRVYTDVLCHREESCTRRERVKQPSGSYSV